MTPAERELLLEMARAIQSRMLAQERIVRLGRAIQAVENEPKDKQ